MLGINEKTNGIFPSYSFSFDNWFLFLLGLFSFIQGRIYFHILKDYYGLVRANSQSSVMVKTERRKRLWCFYHLYMRSASSETCSKLSNEEYIFLLKLCIYSLNCKIYSLSKHSPHLERRWGMLFVYQADCSSPCILTCTEINVGCAAQHALKPWLRLSSHKMDWWLRLFIPATTVWRRSLATSTEHTISFLLHRLCPAVFVRQNQNYLGLPLSSPLIRGCSGRDSLWKEVWCSFLIPVIPSVRECKGLHRLRIRNIINPCFSEQETLGDL